MKTRDDMYIVEPAPIAECVRRTSARWVTVGGDMVERLVDAVLREEAWWTAARCGQYAQLATVWVEERTAPARPFPLPVMLGEAAERRRL